MKPLELMSWAGCGLSSTLFLGFLAHSIPSLWSIVLLLSIVMASILAVNGLTQMAQVSYYERQAIAVSFLLRGVVLIGGLMAIVMIGHWLYVPVEVGQ